MVQDIRRITEPLEIHTIFEIEDERLAKNVNCSRAEWVQYLLRWAESAPERLGLFGVVDQGRVLKYFACINAVDPPVSRSVLIMYQNFYSDHDHGLKAFGLVKQWAADCGAEKICLQTLYPRINRLFGFRDDPAVAMVLEVGA